jgi:hypothetical protein
MDRRTRRSKPMRLLRTAHHLVFDASRQGRPFEIAAWSNAVASLGLGAGTYALTRSSSAAVGAFVLAFVLLRMALAYPQTVCVAASLGTLSVGTVGGALSWLFAHVIEAPSAPSIAGVAGALLSAIAPAWAYANLAQRRAQDIPDSLVEPVSVPSSHG